MLKIVFFEKMRFFVCVLKYQYIFHRNQHTPYLEFWKIQNFFQFLANLIELIDEFLNVMNSQSPNYVVTCIGKISGIVKINSQHLMCFALNCVKWFGSEYLQNTWVLFDLKQVAYHVEYFITTKLQHSITENCIHVFILNWIIAEKLGVVLYL